MPINVFKILIFQTEIKLSSLRNSHFWGGRVCKEAYLLKIYLEVFIKCVCVWPCVHLNMHRDVCTYQCVGACACVCINMEGIGSSEVNVWCLPQHFSTYKSGVQWPQEPTYLCSQLLGLQMCVAIPGVCMYSGMHRTSACIRTLPSSQLWHAYSFKTGVCTWLYYS